MSDRLITTQQAAEELGVTSVRVRAMIRAGQIPAERIGRDYLIKESDLNLVRNRKPGRPRKDPASG